MRGIINYFHRSARATAHLKQDKSSNPKRLKLIIDVSTRWNSTFDTVERYIQLHAAVYGALAKCDKLDGEIMCYTLKPFEEAIILMSSQTHMMASLVRPLLANLLMASKPVPGEPSLIHQAKAALHHDVENRCEKNDVAILNTCTFLDPRVKNMTHMTLDERKDVYDSVSETLKISNPESSNPETVPHAGDCLLASLLSNYKTDLSTNSNPYVDEVKMYIKLPSCGIGADPLLW